MSPLLPAAGFGRLRIEAQVRVCFTVPVEVYFSMRPFAVRRRLQSLRSVSVSASMFPACIFKVILKFPPDPFGPVLPPPTGFLLASRGAFVARYPLSGFPLRTPRLYSGLNSPPGFLNPSGSKLLPDSSRGNLP